MDCGDCFYSQLIDGVLFCNHYCVDVFLTYDGVEKCINYVNAGNVKSILKNYNNFLKDNLNEIDLLYNLEEILDDFFTENKDLL